VSGETEEHVSGWTVDTLKAYFDEIIERETGRIDARFEREHNFIMSLAEERRRAQDKFEATIGERFAQVNEFRGALDDLGKDMATRRELEALSSSLGVRADQNSSSIAELRSRLDIGPAGLAPLQAYQQKEAGRQEGIGASIGLIVTVISVTAAIIGIIVVLANHVQ